MQTTGDIKSEVLVLLGVSTSQAYYTDAILNAWIDKAHKWAAAQYKWPFTQLKDVTQSFNGEVYQYPTNFKSNSIRYLQVGGYRLDKLNYADYQIYREEQSNGKERVFTDFQRQYYINPYIDVGGTITAWGQATPATLDGTDPTATTVFTYSEEEGNEALVEKCMSYANTKEKAPVAFARGHLVSASALHDQNAQAILDGIWQRIKDEQFGYQTKYRGMWKRFDVLRTGFRGELNKENQFF